jgi:hypothetical protein
LALEKQRSAARPGSAISQEKVWNIMVIFSGRIGIFHDLWIFTVVIGIF